MSLIWYLLNENPLSIATALMLLIGLWTYKVIGKYLEELYFRVFPFKNQASEINSLRKELLDEMRRHSETKRIAERAIDVSWRMRSEALEAKRMLAKLGQTGAALPGKVAANDNFQTAKSRL
ncbi:MAG: hypothetical protein R8J41_11010 [Alphaproteobacteria bacterium]|nr:hypothetical protein [Alphaproteobacteria bacterium]